MDRSYALFLTCAIGATTALLSYIWSFASESFARRFGAIDKPTGGRKIHTKPIPLWGGFGIAVSILIVLVTLMSANVFSQGDVHTTQILGFIAGLLILLVGGMIDDAHPLSPQIQILFPILAALVVIASRTGIVQVTNPSGGGLSLIWWRLGPVSLPADLITFAWLLLATYATKIQDGLDGLVTGLTVIGSGLVGALTLSLTFFQPMVALLAGIVGGAYLGFLPRNANPAKQFLGESGGSIAGFSLGVLAVLSSAKIAIALAVLAIPITDVILVVLGRIRRGVPWYKGDSTHLHFRLLQAGFSQRTAVWLLWGVSLVAGLLALSLQTRGKVFLIVTLVGLTALTSFIAGLKSRRAQKDV